MANETWVDSMYKPSDKIPKQYRSAKFEKDIKHVQSNYAGAIMNEYDDVGIKADGVRKVLDRILNELPQDRQLEEFEYVRKRLAEHRDEEWGDQVPEIWYQTPLATLSDANMNLVGLGTGNLSHVELVNVNTGWDILILNN